ncbi:hypothetical protein PTSG_02105 [Salpingoeca rosetta]|uniref:Inositol-1-monophosphatase n=1 Tax=Salpingoeca rosetta (strain ATCC 50818 / BSB-021) TaxID=946362 RepID=F2U184_SALR5|nr:uncharacterized protein PTSG_02105 [Salpingoeca rosetta]EGD81386.1 hypothetical protein PTSG_02105 [Salpingoeca rosetta]|eukprot:XP_004996590.1 hypothetical protein PTSG_02105 [Salpingoeca rosetta]
MADLSAGTLAAVVDIAKEAGEKIRSVFHTPREASVVDDKTVASIDLVTDTDKACEDIIVKRLREKFPGYEVLGEESASENGGYALTDAPTWIIDPIDGTTNFVHRNPEISVSIGLSIKKVPKLGVIYNPIRDECFTAYEGAGASLNGKPIHVDAQPTRLDQLLVSTNIGYLRDDKAIRHMLGSVENMMKQNLRGLRMLGTACNQITGVACGRTNCYYECGPHPWDVCAGVCILREAGGYACDITGAPFSMTSRRYICAASEAIANLILPHIQHPLPFEDVQ